MTPFEWSAVVLLILILLRIPSGDRTTLKSVESYLQMIEQNQRQIDLQLQEIAASVSNLESDVGREIVRRLPEDPPY